MKLRLIKWSREAGRTATALSAAKVVHLANCKYYKFDFTSEELSNFVFMTVLRKIKAQE